MLQALVLFQVAQLCPAALGAGVHLLFGYLCREHSELSSFPPLLLDDKTPTVSIWVGWSL